MKWTEAEWVNTVIDELADHELYEGTPTTDGLRRVTEKLYGKILRSRTKIIKVEKDYVVASHSLTILRYEDDARLQVNACVDVWKKSLPAPFNAHVVSTACTRAEGKALRRALRIRIQTAEEIANVDEGPADSSINDQQKMAIRTLCKRLGVDIDKLTEGKDLDKLSNTDGRGLIDKLSSFQRTGVQKKKKK